MGAPLAPPITTRADLIGFAERLQGVAEIGFDTEFHAEQTYFAKVMLLQFSTPDEIVLVDPLAPEVKGALGGFLELIKMREQTILGHALERDLEIFLRLNGGLPKKVFDTQVASAFLDTGGPIGLGPLLQRRLGIEVDKLYTRADWGRRPLPDGQAEYAADDVRHLFALVSTLREELNRRDRLEWVEEECRALLDPKRLVAAPPELAWRRVSRKPSGPRARALLVELAAERERIAEETNVPPRRVIGDEVLVDLSRRAPRRASELDSDTRRKPAPNLKKHANRWLEAIQVGLEAEVPVETTPFTGPTKAVADLAEWLAASTLEAVDISPHLLPSSFFAALRGLVETPADSQDELTERLGLEGWRAALLAEPIWQLLGREAQVVVSRDGEALRANLFRKLENVPE